MMWRVLALASLLLGLSACSLQRSMPERPFDWDARRADLSAVSTWELRGRVAIKSDQGGGQGKLRWTQSDNEAQVNIAGPFGAGAVEIRWTPDEILITDGKGEVAAGLVGPDAASRFLQAQLGWSFPILSTPYWLLGVPSPAAPYRESFDAQGWLQTIEQQTWTIRYDGFAERAGHWLPRKLSLQSAEGRLRVVIDHWEPATVLN